MLQHSPPPQGKAKRQRRRGATMMEYLVVLSFLFIIAMTGVNYFGQATKKVTEETSEALKKASNNSNP